MKKWMIILSLLIGMFIFTEPAYADENAFEGTRKVTYSISMSDLENYVQGGFAGFDYALRMHQDSQFAYELHQVDEQLYFTFVFPFKSYEEYRQKMANALGFEPVIYYKQGEKLELVEGFYASEVCNFFTKYMEEKGLTWDITLKDIVKYENTILCVNEEEYTYAERVEQYEAIEVPFTYDELSVEISYRADKYFANVTARPYDAEQNDALRTQLSKYGQVEESGYLSRITYTVMLEASSKEELLKRLYECTGLYIATSVVYQDVDEEYVDCVVDTVILSDKVKEGMGAVGYQIKYNGEASKFVSLTEGTKLGDNEVSFSYDGNNYGVRYVYQTDRPKVEDVVLETSVSVETDVTDAWGRYSRTITYQIPKVLVENSHQQMLAYIDENITKDMQAEIYDEGEYRNYKILISSRNSKKISEFTKIFLGEECVFKAEDALWFWQKDVLSDTVKVDASHMGIQTLDKVQFYYHLGDEEKNIDDIRPFVSVEHTYGYAGFNNNNILAILIGAAIVVVIVVYCLTLAKKVRIVGLVAVGILVVTVIVATSQKPALLSGDNKNQHADANKPGNSVSDWDLKQLEKYNPDGKVVVEGKRYKLYENGVLYFKSTREGDIEEALTSGLDFHTVYMESLGEVPDLSMIGHDITLVLGKNMMLSNNYVEMPFVSRLIVYTEDAYIDSRFELWEQLEEVWIMSPSAKVSRGAFKYCASLKKAYLPDGMETIEGSAFEGCVGLEDVHLPNTLTNIPNMTFAGCKALVTVDIPDSVTQIGEKAFYNCIALEEITIPASVASIETDAFCECTSLTKIRVPEPLDKQMLSNACTGIVDYESIIEYYTP